MRNSSGLFRPLKDPRASNTRHDLVDILVIALAATLAGAKTCTEFEFFGQSRQELLRRFLDSAGIPSHDTFSNVLRMLDPKGLEAVLRKFSKSFGVKGVVSIDGKALRGAFTRGRQATPLHMVNVWAAGASYGVGSAEGPQSQRDCRRSRSARAARSGRCCCHRRRLALPAGYSTATRDRKGHYVLAIKSNRGRLFKAAKTLVDTTRKPARASQRRVTAHGRVEHRRAIIASAPQLAKQYGFPAIAAVGRIDSWRATAGKAAKHKVRYFLASRLLSAKKLLEVVRAHWSIENNLHWVLDVLFDEDACRSRKDHVAENSPSSASWPSMPCR